MFDLEAWLDVNLSGRRNGDEYSSQCPYCGKTGKFSVNIEKKLFRCFSGSCQASGRVWQLMNFLEGISGQEARRLLGSETFAQKPAFMKRQAVTNKRWDIPLPEEFIPCFQSGRDPEFRIIQHLKERLRPETLKSFGVGFCKTGKYFNRAIIPVRSQFGNAWTARDATNMHKEDLRRPKYNNPAGEWAQDLLMGWEHYEPGADLCLVEGPFDVMRLYEHGIHSFGLLGKKLGAGQRAQLLTLPSNTYVTILIDPEEKRWTVDDIRDSLSLKFKNLFIGQLPEGVDPGSSTKKQARKAIDDARPAK